MYDGYDLCEQVRLDKLSAFNTKDHVQAFFSFLSDPKITNSALWTKLERWYENAAAAISVGPTD